MRREDLMNVIIPFFERYQLCTAKKDDFKFFARCIRLMQTQAHLTKNGIAKIALLAEKMNHRKSRSDLIRILRDQTPTSI